MSHKNIIRRDHELREDKKFLKMLDDMPIEERGLFMSLFVVDKFGYVSIPESTLREFQDTIMKYYFLSNKRS